MISQVNTTNSMHDSTYLPITEVMVTENNTNFTRPSYAYPRVTVDSLPAYVWAMDLLRYVLPVIIFVGIIGNVLSFLTMIQREMRHTSTFFYLAALAIADTVVLLLSALKTWIRVISGFEMLHISPVACKVLIFITHFSVHFSAWLIVAVTIERFLAVWFPLKATTMCSVSRAKFVTFMTALIFVLINAHTFFTAELLQRKTPTGQVVYQCDSYAFKNFVCEIFPWIYLVLYSFLPVLILLIFNSLIIYSLAINKPLLGSMTKDDRQNITNHRRLAATLVVISLVWIVTTVPRPVQQLVMNSRKFISAQDRAEAILGRVVCYLLMYVNHGINFFIYGITGQRFRLELRRLLCKMTLKTRKPQPRLMFKSSGSGSGQESSIPLVTTPNTDIQMSTFA